MQPYTEESLATASLTKMSVWFQMVFQQPCLLPAEVARDALAAKLGVRFFKPRQRSLQHLRWFSGSVSAGDRVPTAACRCECHGG